MSDISVNINPSAEAAQTRAPSNHRRRRRWLQNKRRHLEENDSMEGKQKKKRKRRKKFAQHQSSEAEQRTLFSAPFKKLEFPNSTNSKYKSLTFTQNNFLPSSGSSSKPSTSTENSISSAPTSSSFKASTSAGNKNVSPSSSGAVSSFKASTSAGNKNVSPSLSGAVSSFKASTSEPNKGLPHLNSSASTHSLPSSNNKHLYDTPKELWSAALAAAAAAPASSATSSNKQATSKTSAAAGIPTKYLAIDCEMVGTGPKGSISQLARCSVVNYEGDVVYDKFINPSMPVTDYRTKWSGIRRCDLINATPYSVARKEILKLLAGKVVIGHAVHNDFKVLSYSHPSAMTRDTARIPLLNQRAGFEGNQSASLKRLTKAIFNRDIQTGKKGHSSVEDAKATMELYKVVEEEWERTLAARVNTSSV